MAYSKTTWANGTTPAISAANLNKMEQGIYDNSQSITQINDNIDIWKHKLTACNCIYVISDSKTGKLYVGSTYNLDGIWGRWKEYANTGHGGNVELIKLLGEDPNYAKDNFTWSILQTLPLKINEKEAVRIETLWKDKLGREACKLNKN